MEEREGKEDFNGEKEKHYKYLASVYEACTEISSAEIIAALERALHFCPEKREDILRIAVGLPNLAESTPGKAYIKKLERAIRETKK